MSSIKLNSNFTHKMSTINLNKNWIDWSLKSIKIWSTLPKGTCKFPNRNRPLIFSKYSNSIFWKKIILKEEEPLKQWLVRVAIVLKLNVRIIWITDKCKDFDSIVFWRVLQWRWFRWSCGLTFNLIKARLLHGRVQNSSMHTSLRP